MDLPFELEFDCVRMVRCVCGDLPTRLIKLRSWEVGGSLLTRHYCRNCTKQLLDEARAKGKAFTLTSGPEREYSLQTLFPTGSSSK